MIFRYLARQVLTTMLAVTFVLLLVFMSGRFIKYLAKAASGGISPDVLFAVMAYRLPGFLELILPLGFFIGILLAYGRMYLESEMTVLHACGMSQNKLLSLTLIMSVFVMLLVGSMSVYLTPWGMQNVERLFAEQSKMTEFEMLSPGRFQSLKSGERVTYTESLSQDKKMMYNVFIAEKADQEKGVQLLYAEKGEQHVDSETGERFLVLSNGTRYQGLPGKAKYSALDFGQYGIRIDEPDDEKKSVKDEAIPTSELYRSDNPEYMALYQWRVSLPLLVPVVTLLAVALCRVNPRQGRYFHLFPSMLVYITYLGLLIVVRKKLAKDEYPEVLGLWSVHIAFALLALAVFGKDRLRQMLSSNKGV